MAKKKPNRRHDHLFQIRVAPEQLEAFRKAAEKDGRTVSNWARERLDRASRQELGSRKTD
jgi:predicted HicB family RNase H-like nuclease